MIDEIQKSIKASLYERATSPLVGAFTISWLFTNWQLLFITFFESKTTLGKSKVQYIEAYVINAESFYLIPKIKLWLIPLVYTTIIIWLLPYLSELAFKLKEQSKARKLNIKLKAEKTVHLKIEESIKLRNQIRDLQKEFEESNSEKSEEYFKLKTKNDEQISLLSKNKETIESLEKKASNLYSDKKSSKEYANKLKTIVDNNRKTIKDNFKYQAKNHDPRYLKFNEQEKQKIEIIMSDYNELSGTNGLKQSDIEYLILKNIIIDTTPNASAKNYRLTDFGLYVSNQLLTQYL